MNRQEFCEILVKAKKDSGVSTSELSFNMKMLYPTLRRLERGIHSFSMAKCMEYLNTIHFHLLLSSIAGDIIVFNYTDLIEAIKTARVKSYTQRSLADKAGISSVYIANIERGKITLTIDKFLTLATALNIQINIVPNAK